MKRMWGASTQEIDEKAVKEAEELRDLAKINDFLLLVQEKREENSKEKFPHLYDQHGLFRSENDVKSFSSHAESRQLLSGKLNEDGTLEWDQSEGSSEELSSGKMMHDILPGSLAAALHEACEKYIVECNKTEQQGEVTREACFLKICQVLKDMRKYGVRIDQKPQSSFSELPWRAAIQWCNPKLMELLLGAGLPANTSLLNKEVTYSKEDKNYENLLHYAVANVAQPMWTFRSEEEIARQRQDAIAMVKLLIHYGADPDLQNSLEQSAFQLATPELQAQMNLWVNEREAWEQKFQKEKPVENWQSTSASLAFERTRPAVTEWIEKFGLSAQKGVKSEGGMEIGSKNQTKVDSQPHEAAGKDSHSQIPSKGL
jgi:hypothetical protein